MKIVYFDLDDIKNPLLAAGQAHATYEVAKRLVARGHQVTVYASNYPGAKDRTTDGISYKHIGLAFPHIKLNNFWYFIAAPLKARTLQPNTTDLIIECFTAPLSTLNIPRITRIPVVAVPSMFNAKEFSKKYHLPLEWYERWGVSHYRWALPYSDTDRKKFVTYNPKITTKIVPQGVGEEYFRIRHQRPKHILFLSRFDMHQKGIDLLLEAYAQIADQVKYPLVLAGHGPDEQKIANLIAKFDLNKKVTIVGGAYGKKKHELMAHAVSVVFPSRHDEMCLWTLEALAAGLPHIAFDLPESKWIPTAFCKKVKPYNVRAFGAAIMVMAKEEKRKTLGAKAKAYARKYTWDHVVSEYESFFTDVVSQTKKTL